MPYGQQVVIANETLQHKKWRKITMGKRQQGNRLLFQQAVISEVQLTGRWGISSLHTIMQEKSAQVVACHPSLQISTWI